MLGSRRILLSGRNLTRHSARFYPSAPVKVGQRLCSGSSIGSEPRPPSRVGVQTSGTESAVVGDPDLELPPVKPVRTKPVVRQFETVKAPTSRKITPERATLLARINEIFARHERTRSGFLQIVQEYRSMDKMLRGHPEFINTAVTKMEEFDVHNDLQCYQEIINCFPKGRYLPQTLLDEVMPASVPQTDAAVALLRKMDRNGVIPSYELVESLSAILGWRSMASVIALEIGWWKSMFQDSDQYYLASQERYRPFIMAGFVLKRMAGKASRIQVVRSESPSPNGPPWVLATQTRRQASRAKKYERSDLPLYVEGPRLIYMQAVPHYYYVLMVDAQLSDEDSDDPGERTAISICTTPTGCVESVSAWIESVKKMYPKLADCQIFFNQKTLPKSPYECFRDISVPLSTGVFSHQRDAKLKPDQQDLDDRLLGDPF